jgi:hypothetical protein
MTIFHADPTSPITCALSVTGARDRLAALRAITGDRLEAVSREGPRLRMRIRRAGSIDLESEAIAWAEAEQACCPFLGFAVESDASAVSIEISAPEGAESTLGVIEWVVRSAGPSESPA